MATAGSVVLHALSSDTKPTALPTGQDLPVPSFLVTDDTGDAFLWTGAAWRPAPASLGLLARLVALQTDANEMLAEIWRESAATRMAVQELYNEGRPDHADFRELALAATDRTETEEP